MSVDGCTHPFCFLGQNKTPGYEPGADCPRRGGRSSISVLREYYLYTQKRFKIKRKRVFLLSSQESNHDQYV